MSASLGNSANAEPDLTPMLDMVFQLITFFMLVIKFKEAAIDDKLHLPVVGSAAPVDTKGQRDLLLLNITKNGSISYFKQEHDNIEEFISGSAEQSKLLARKTNPDFKDTDILPTTVVIRADKDTPFAKLNRIIKACQKENFREFALRASSGKKKGNG